MDTPLPRDPYSHNPGDDGDRSTGSTVSLEGQILTCILKLMQPTLSAHLNIPEDHVETQLRKAAASNEGNELISALNNFIKAGVLRATQQTENALKAPLENKSHNSSPSLDDTDGSGESPIQEPERSPSALQLRIPLPDMDSELASMIQIRTRAHVNNNMPIRMLEFDADGSNIKLIGRDDIFRILIPRVEKNVTSPEFQQAWNEALGLRDIGFTYLDRSDKLNYLIAKAISEVASYAILSHTWIRESPGEVVFNTWNSRFQNERGWKKVTNFCRVAANEHKMTLGWVDSACINKESSSELDESIRSMYKWYRGSHICIAYLSETEALGDGVHDSWFTRGWTLQELLAPHNVSFYNRQWEALGTNNDSTIISLITTESSIDEEELEKCRTGQLEYIAISRILQMASQRQVTREEDSSYSLLGLLNVNISVAYGEGEKSAFRRLFQELLVTRKYVIDLFNRQYTWDDSLIPSSLKKYSTRSRSFDGDYGRNLDTYQPPEPITLTHLGVRCQWLLLPSFTVAEGTPEAVYVPKGHYSAQLPSTMLLNNGDPLEIFHNLLDTRLYNDQIDYVHPLSEVLTVYSRQPTIAIPTFTIKGDVLVLPECSMGIMAYTPDKPGTVHTGSVISIMSTQQPDQVRLINSTGGPLEIPIADLGLHGMQLVTLYL